MNRQEALDPSPHGQGVHLVKKNNAVPVHAMKAYRGRRGIAPLILNLNFKPQELRPRERKKMTIE